MGKRGYRWGMAGVGLTLGLALVPVFVHFGMLLRFGLRGKYGTRGWIEIRYGLLVEVAKLVVSIVVSTKGIGGSFSTADQHRLVRTYPLYSDCHSQNQDLSHHPDTYPDPAPRHAAHRTAPAYPSNTHTRLL